MAKRYLLATDGTDSSRASEDYARSILSSEDTVIHLLTVIDLFDERKITEFSPGLSVDELQERHEEKAFKKLKPKAEAFEEAGFRTEIDVIHGRPGHEICRCAQDLDVNGIFVGRGRHSRLGEMFLGSVSHYVVLHSSQSVFITPSTP